MHIDFSQLYGARSHLNRLILHPEAVITPWYDESTEQAEDKRDTASCDRLRFFFLTRLVNDTIIAKLENEFLFSFLF